FFFFQAEDGIRDYKVTGVQTCALPISQFTLPSAPVANLARGQVRSLQVLLASEGFDVPVTGQWDAPTSAALLGFQRAWSVPPTEIGRASCRERVWISEGASALKKKEGS